MIARAESLHQQVTVTWIEGPNPPKQLIRFGDVGIPLAEAPEFVVITTDGTRH